MSFITVSSVRDKIALGLTTDWIYRTLCIQISEAGYRTSEPEGAVGEKSLILEKVFKALRDEGISKSKVASELLVPIEEIDALTFNLTLNILPGGRLQNSPVLNSDSRNLLKLVHSSDN